MVKTKGTDSDEGGIAVGFYVVDFLLLVDEYIEKVCGFPPPITSDSVEDRFLPLHQILFC